ncbi:glycosyltransferase WbsX family protein [Algoriphagus resistens]|uniref:glycosyltransferase WbsX family protein n=1 Tax=Algoriphagus resistens TaxID=1750590 RepID=UPI0007168DB5|nr:glycoside hydrolase family 99-like domain-containing protein [Algoriphagus resistens]
MNNQIKPIALYLPQFHAIAENDKWWGKGFTEWTNVRKATPGFENHYQPHVPLNEDYYTLDDVEVMRKQALLAQSHGIYGFCFYHYWFNGKLLLEKPIHQWMEATDIDFPFCLSWANENWTRRWDGKDKEQLIAQQYDLEDDRKHIQYLIQFFKDERYIKVGNKPVFLMYRSESHPYIKKATSIWREEVIKAGFDGLYLIRMENFEQGIDPALHGFDAGMEFAPERASSGGKILKDNKSAYLFHKTLHTLGVKPDKRYENGIYDYGRLIHGMSTKETPPYTYFRCCCPGWDNSARRKQNAIIYINSDPEKFQQWFEFTKEWTEDNLPEELQFVFINAWNEWAEGCHLEPDNRWNYEYLLAVKNTLGK